MPTLVTFLQEQVTDTTTTAAQLAVQKTRLRFHAEGLKCYVDLLALIYK
jgi:hypothetical protein